MPVRKNARYLTAPERTNLVRAFVALKADQVPGESYSRYDEFVIVHRYIQNATAPNIPGPSSASGMVNFGHGGFAFCPWHRYFIWLMETRLREKIAEWDAAAAADFALPYWDWTDPDVIMTQAFMGPMIGAGAGNQIDQGYFALNSPGSGGNTTPLPAWWPPGFSGWNGSGAISGFGGGGLRRNIGSTGIMLPNAGHIAACLAMPSYGAFRSALESGSGIAGTNMHNHIHLWFGSSGTAHMRPPNVSPFDPMFYLHHANVDRLWAMWQMDGHESDYPDMGGANHHRLNDPMYPWVGDATGYSPNNLVAGIAMPFSSVFPATPADVLNHRSPSAVLPADFVGYSYDTQVVFGLGVDKTGSMLGMVPDPMIGGEIIATKWDAAKAGVSAFLQDCETAYAAKTLYVAAGIKTFRRQASNDFAPVFADGGFGLVKPEAGWPFTAAAFDAAIAAQSPGGSTPLVDALTDLHATVVDAAFGGEPGDERRYLALFTDGLRTSGATLGSLPNGSLQRTAVCAMGFGIGAGISDPALNGLVNKGAAPGAVFHGDSSAAIDKFLSECLAAANGYTPVMDPVFDMFAGEHTHFEFTATAAEDHFYLTAQGMDFDDNAWSFQLMGPDGYLYYADGTLPAHDRRCECDSLRRPDVTARRGKGRLTAFIRRDSAAAATWVGAWMLIIGRWARDFDAMLMVNPAALMVPAAVGPVRGARFARLILEPKQRQSVRSIPATLQHEFDDIPVSTNRTQSPCAMAVNVYARTLLDLRLVFKSVPAGEPMHAEVPLPEQPQFRIHQAVARIFSPTANPFGHFNFDDKDQVNKLRKLLPRQLRKRVLLDRKDPPVHDLVLLLAVLEQQNPDDFVIRDQVVSLLAENSAKLQLKIDDTRVPGRYSMAVWLQGDYLPGEGQATASGGGHHAAGEADSAQVNNGSRQPFTRLLTVSAASIDPAVKP